MYTSMSMLENRDEPKKFGVTPILKPNQSKTELTALRGHRYQTINVVSIINIKPSALYLLLFPLGNDYVCLLFVIEQMGWYKVLINFPKSVPELVQNHCCEKKM